MQARGPESSPVDDVNARWMAAMRAGDWEAAWRETDRVERPRRVAEASGGFSWSPNYLLWNGADFAGRAVVVRCNHGLGDTLQFARFFVPLARVAKSVTVLAQPPLVELLAVCGGMGTVVDGWTANFANAGALEVECMELAYAFRSTPATLPGAVPYLSPERISAAVEAADWNRRRGAALRVGLVWGASAWDQSRSVPLKALAPLAGVSGVEFFSLQQGGEAGQWREAAFPLATLAPFTEKILDAAAAMLALDLIITVDTMAAHLAGALGRPVWLLLQAEADWRWMDGREKSPWYPTMRIFRQPIAGDWQNVISRVVIALKELTDRR